MLYTLDGETNKETIKVKILKQGAKLPTKETDNSAGNDLYIVNYAVIIGGNRTSILTGIAITSLFGTYEQIKGRSSLALKGLDIVASVIDVDYTREISMVMTNSRKTK